MKPPAIGGAGVLGTYVAQWFYLNFRTKRLELASQRLGHDAHDGSVSDYDDCRDTAGSSFPIPYLVLRIQYYW